MRRRLLTQLTDDEGFSLSELVIVVGLLGFVLAAIYSASYAMTAAGKVNDAQSVFARDGGEPVRLVEKAVMQNLKIRDATPYMLDFYTDRNLDAFDEEVIVQATTAGELRYEEWQCDPSLQRVSKTKDLVFTTNCSNLARSIPLFVYYDKGGTVIGPTVDDIRTQAPGQSRKVAFSLSLTTNGFDTTIDRQMYFRNRD